MMENRRIIGLILLITVIIMYTLSGCATYDNFKNEYVEIDQEPEDTVRIGVFEPLSGKDKKFGELEKMGIELANELYPTALAKRVELVYADNQGDIYVAESAIQDLISKRPAIVLGSYGSVNSLVAVKYLQDAKIPAISLTNTNPLVTSNNPFYFRVCFVESYQGVAVAKYAVEELKMKTAAVLKPVNDDQAASVSQTFSDKMVQLTENQNAVAIIQEYKEGDKDFTKQLERIARSEVPAVFLPAKLEDAVNILKQAEEMKLGLTFLGTSQLESKQLVEKAGKKAAEGVAFSTIFDPESGMTDMTGIFLNAFHKKYGEDAVPEPATALGFDAYMIAISSINRIGTALDGELLRCSIALERDFPGASGKITFDINGDPIKSVVIKKVHNGKIENAYTVEPVWGELEV